MYPHIDTAEKTRPRDAATAIFWFRSFVREPVTESTYSNKEINTHNKKFYEMQVETTC